MYKLVNKKILVTCMLLIIFALVSNKIIGNIDAIFMSLVGVIDFCLKILIPFIIGLFAALILNSPVRWFEKQLKSFNKGKTSKLIRMTSVFTVYFATIGIITLIIVYLIPTFTGSVSDFNDFINKIPENLKYLDDTLNSVGIDVNFTEYEKEVSNTVSEFIKNKDNITNLLIGVANVTSTFFNIVMGIIISFYVLVDKERMGFHVRKIVYALFDEKTAKRFFEFCYRIDETFSKFIVGKMLDSIIIGLLCYIGLAFLNIKFAFVYSIIIGITNMIPYFGPFLGGVPVIILVFLYEPALALPVALFILLLQQFDGNILGPMVLGDAIGVRPISVIFAILIGGSLGGVLGMFIAVPAFVIISEITTGYIDKKYIKKYGRGEKNEK